MSEEVKTPNKRLSNPYAVVTVYVGGDAEMAEEAARLIKAHEGKSLSEWFRDHAREVVEQYNPDWSN